MQIIVNGQTIVIDAVDPAAFATALRAVANAITSAPPASGPLVTDNGDNTVTLPRTGHKIPMPAIGVGEGLMGYFQRVSGAIGANMQTAGALAMGGAATYDLLKSGNPLMDWPVLVDAFANPSAYGVGSAGQPGVAAAP